MKQHNLIVLLTFGIYWEFVNPNSLSPRGENVCSTIVSSRQRYTVSESYSTSYSAYTCCGFFCWDRCHRTRYSRNYRLKYQYRTIYSTEYICCEGWAAAPSSNECKIPICPPRCVQGNCDAPSMCNCYTGYHGPTCENSCNANVANCEIVDCTHSSNSRCTKCLYHINNNIKAYSLVNGRCNQICSWRPDSRTCYPGTCTSGTSCMCDSNFNTDNNCMTIDDKPTVSHCSVVLQDDTANNYVINTQEINCQSTSSTPVYVSIEGNGLSVNWQTRYTGPSVAQYPFPYYVNDFKVGIISSRVDWKIFGDTTANGTIDCNLNHNQDDPNMATHSCVQYGQLSQSLKSGDSLTITAISENGGYLLLNNYDLSTTPTVSDPIYYTGQNVTSHVTIIIDLDAPTHCSVTQFEATPCAGVSLDIGNPYTKANEIEVKWSTWEDEESGLIPDPYECRVCKMIAENNVFASQELCKPMVPSTIEGVYEAEFQPTAIGVYCAILGVSDVAGNVRYARRCFIFDDESNVTIVADSPLSLMVEEETLNLLETDAWTTGNKDIQISWHGHFTNQLHIDQKLLLPIEVDIGLIHAEYDSEASPIGRPLTALENRGGIVKFEVGVHKDTVGGETFPTFEPSYESLPNDLDEFYINTLDNAKTGDTFGFWVRATDVMGNTNSDYMIIHIDSTQPQFETFDTDTNGDGVFEMTAYDRESGIESVYWQLLSMDLVSLSDGYTLNFRADRGCSPTECYCILANKYCYKLVLDVIPTLDKSIHGSVTSALLRVTIKNNALLETTQEMEVTTSNIGQKTSKEMNGSGLGIGIGVGVGLFLLIVLIVALILRKKYREANGNAYYSSHQDQAFVNAVDKEDFNSHQNHQNQTFANESECNEYSNTSPVNHSLYTTTEEVRLEDEYEAPISLGVTGGYSANATAKEVNPTEIAHKADIVQGNNSVVYQANVPSLGLVNVAVKSVKAVNTADQKATLLHEIKMMRKFPRHDNVIQLVGFTSNRDPVALIMEYAPHGDLSKYLQQQDPQNQLMFSNSSETLSISQLCVFARHVSYGMQHLQSHKIIHRNLGARNILLDDNMICKITDFGRAVEAGVDGTYIETQEIQLPVRLTAVEGLNEKHFSMKSDVWSFGVLMWEILSLGSKPYGNKPIKEIAEDVVGGSRLTKPQNCPDAAYSIMEACWRSSADTRPTFQQLLLDLNKIIKINQ